MNRDLRLDLQAAIIHTFNPDTESPQQLITLITQLCY